MSNINDDISYVYLSISDINTPEYEHFIEEHHGVGSYPQRKERLLWYCSLGNDSFRVLAAKLGDLYVGQSCAYRVEAVINGKLESWWWGVDTFVLPKMRGKGVGKHLQGLQCKELHPFSSAWYSPINGIIKRKCGCHGILDFPFAFYPVSCFMSIGLELLLKKAISRKISIPRIRIPYVYPKLNGGGRHWIKEYSIEKRETTDLPMFSSFMEECLADMHFHIVRSEQYIKWKYIDNPRMHCNVFCVKKDGNLAGLIVSSDVRNGSVVMAKARVVKIYESIFKKDSGLSHKRLLLLLTDFLRAGGTTLDGFLSLQSISYWPKLVYPRPCSQLLTTYPSEKLTSGYITYSDQDME